MKTFSFLKEAAAANVSAFINLNKAAVCKRFHNFPLNVSVFMSEGVKAFSREGIMKTFS